jgi:methionine-rich copper-binding protein CopC
MQAVRFAAAVLAIAGFATLAGAQDVLGHADYASSTPGRNEVVQEPPAQVEVTFTQEVFRREGENFVRVFDEAEVQVSEGDGVVDDDDRTLITAQLPPDLEPGRYIVRWKTLSAEDGDDDEGALCFYVQVEPTEAQEAECAEFDEDAEGTATPAATGAETPDGGTAPSEVTATPVPATDGTESNDGGGMSTAAIVGIVIAVGVGVVVVVAGVAVWLRKLLE